MDSNNSNNSISHYFIYGVKFLKIFVLLLLASTSVMGQDQTPRKTVTIPEPLMFDLVRGLGARQGELEINSLAEFPLTNASDRGVDWAPEIEYALFDNFSIEAEFPLNNFKLEALKMAIQWTIGTSQDNKYIHGIQIIGESLLDDDILELHFLYLPGYRFNEVWSAIGLFGVMLEYGDDSPAKNYTMVLNASLFADINKNTIVGVEVNNTNKMIQKIDDNKMELLVLPQVHYLFDSGFSFQFGVGPRFTANETNASAVMRVIKSF